LKIAKKFWIYVRLNSIKHGIYVKSDGFVTKRKKIMCALCVHRLDVEFALTNDKKIIIRNYLRSTLLNNWSTNTLEKIDHNI